MIQTINPTTFQSHIKTTEDVTFFLSFLEKLNTELFKKDRTLAQILEQEISYQNGLTLKKIAASHNVNLAHAAEVVNFLTKLTEAVNALPVMHLTLAFPPKEGLITTISQWFMVNMREYVILEITVDRSLLAGAVVSFNGKRKDFSLKQQLFSREQRSGNSVLEKLTEP